MPGVKPEPRRALAFITGALRGSSSWQSNCHGNIPALSHARQVGRTMKNKRGIPMRELKESKSAVDGENRTSEQQKSKPGMEGLSRRTFLGVGSATLASAALASVAVNVQERVDTEQAERDHSTVTFQQDSPTRSKGWDRMVVNFCWYSMKVRFRKTTPSFFPIG